MHVEPQKEHKWLQQLVGEWTTEIEAEMEPGKPVKLTGTETVRSLGDLWILCEGTGEIPGGGTAKMIFTFGYDPQKQAFVGTFLGTMMAYLWVYEGSLDAAERALSMHTEGPNPEAGGKMMKMKDVFELKSDDHRTLTGYALREDGEWQQVMQMNYYRKK